MSIKRDKKGQVTIFIILAIILIVLVGTYLILKGNGVKKVFSDDFKEIHNEFLDCVENQVLLGVSILEAQGGYIESPDFEPGSVYMPFSSHLNFMGLDIPYWYYVSGNNIQKQQIPSKLEMEEDLENFLEERVLGCRLSDYFSEDYSVYLGNSPEVDLNIRDNEINVDLELDLIISKGEKQSVYSNHNLKVSTKLGELYNDALEIYSQEVEEMFLENYTLDVLRTYAPVDGVELSCKPLVWDASEVVQNLSEALEGNIFALKTEGDSKDYFLVDTKIKNSARFLTFSNWPNTYEITPSQGNLLVSKPLGNSGGMGILGFCYVPYHFVYDIKYPILIQVYEGNEIFQFPFAVVIDNNMPRKGLKVEEDYISEEFDFCSGAPSLTKINLYDKGLRAVDGEVFYECFGMSCNLGESLNGELEEFFPQCVNGNLRVVAEGFREYSGIHSIVSSGAEIIVILDKEFTLDLDLIVGEEKYLGEALINFVSDGISRSVVYPEQSEIVLSEGEYEVQVIIYGSSNIVLGEGGTYEQCVDGYFLGIGKKCYDIEFSESSIDYSLIGGGKLNYYFGEEQLKNSNKLSIITPDLRVPESIEELQENYILVGAQKLEVRFS